MDKSVAGVTVKVAVPVLVPELAVMTDVPAKTPVARPAAVVVAMLGDPEVKTETAVMSLVVPSEKVPMAVNCWVAAIAIAGVAGTTDIDTRNAGETVSVADPCKPPKLAVMIVDPLLTPLVIPETPLTVPPDVQVDVAVTSREEPSLYVAVATNCCAPPIATVAVNGMTVTLASAAAGRPKIGF